MEQQHERPAFKPTLITYASQGMSTHNDSDTSVLAPSPATESDTFVPSGLIDDIGQEVSEHADIWTVYNEESAKYDISIAEACNRNIDVLLVFTGLFSAVLTTFIVQSYQLMLPNPMDTTNTLLNRFISSQLVSINASNTLINIPSGSMDGPTFLELRWVNGLWFAALACSLSTALFSMLAKHWLQGPPNVSGTPKYRARQRQRRYMQMHAWHVLTVINALPLLLHATLLLFFAGLLVLLWTGNHAITIVTCAIVALVFACYFALMLLSMLYPECPYQHPISEQFRHWISLHYRASTVSPRDEACELTWREFIGSKSREDASYSLNMIDEDDFIDASALIWLIEKSPNVTATVSALQAIAGLPRNFSAFHPLRQAGAISLVLREFKACFHRDSTLDSHWYVINAENAEKYCRAWMRLTYGTSQTWPQELTKPLEALEEIDDPCHVKIIAACTRAIANVKSRDGRSVVLSHLKQCTTKNPLQLSYEIQCWLIDTFLQCSLVSRQRFRPKDHIVKEAIPILVHLLHYTKHTMASHVRSAVALSLSYLTGGSADTVLFSDEEKRKEQFYELIIPSLTAIAIDPAEFGADETVLDLVAMEFSRLASLSLGADQLYQPSERNFLKPVAQRGLSKLFIEGRITHLPQHIIADVLQILYPPVILPRSEHPFFVKALLRTLWTATEPPVMAGALRLLEPLFLHRHPAVLDIFLQEKGMDALLRVAHLGDTASRRLQLDCMRNICLFIRIVTEFYSSDFSLSEPVKTTMERRLDYIFRSDFFFSINQVVSTRRWWLPEIADIWMPALIKLCELRPQEDVWKTIEPTFRKFAESNDGKHGCHQLLADLESMQMLISSVVDKDQSLS